MDADFLKEYQQKEHEYCLSLYKNEFFHKATLRERLRMLLGTSSDREIIYCESGGIENIYNFPDNKSLLMTVFPYKTTHFFERHLGSLNDFIENCENNNRIIPVIQNPLYYVGLKHLKPLFDSNQAVCYFIRGQYAFASIMGENNPVFIEDTFGGFSLVPLVELMNLCEKDHPKWLKNVIESSDCWESRYRRIGNIGYKERRRIKESMKYRYASVAYFLGQDIADEIIDTFIFKTSSKILLHLHILFDHVIAHGFGSHFIINKNTDEGKDFIQSKFSLVKQFEKFVCEDLELLFPTENDNYFKQLLKHEHPLQGIKLNNLDIANIDEISFIIHRQFDRFNKRIKSLENKKRLIKTTFTISLFLMAAFVGKDNLAAGSLLAAAGLEDKSLRIPEKVYNGIVGILKKLYEHSLVCFLLDSRWEK